MQHIQAKLHAENTGIKDNCPGVGSCTWYVLSLQCMLADTAVRCYSVHVHVCLIAQQTDAQQGSVMASRNA